MITVRQIQRLWTAKAHEKLLRQLLAPRAEASARLDEELGGSVAAAAMVAVRLDELAQSYVPLFGEMVRAILKAQFPDGGWGDPLLTALCLRALMCGDGNGPAVDRGLAHLAGLQRDEGIWPALPVRRMPADAFASAFILMQLGDHEAFREAVQLDRATEWFQANDWALDTASRKLWGHARQRCSTARSGRGVSALAWS